MKKNLERSIRGYFYFPRPLFPRVSLDSNLPNSSNICPFSLVLSHRPNDRENFVRFRPATPCLRTPVPTHTRPKFPTISHGEEGLRYFYRHSTRKTLVSFFFFFFFSFPLFFGQILIITYRHTYKLTLSSNARALNNVSLQVSTLQSFALVTGCAINCISKR